MIIEHIDLITTRAEDDNVTSGVVVRMHSSTGLTGLGEAVFDDSHRTTSHANVLAWLKLYDAQVQQVPCANINELNRRLDMVDEGASQGCPSARAAIEMAALDVVSKARNRPLHETLGGGYRELFDLSIDIDGEEANLPARAVAAVQRGYAGVRLTMARPQQRDEAERKRLGAADIREVLEACGSDIAVELVCHQAFANESTASMLLQGVHEGGLYRNFSLVQPLDEGDLVGHGRLREKHPSPIVLEEGVSSPAAMAQIVRHSAADRVVLDLWRVGGLYNAKKIANICESAAIGIIVSGRCRTAVGRAAVGHLAAILHGSHPIALSASEADDDLVHGGLVIVDGKAKLGSGPGLGVALVETVVAGSRLVDCVGV